jgi:hypothetical protein
MAISRYDGRRILNNSLPMYRELLQERGRVYITHYGTPTMRYPTAQEMSTLTMIGHIWTIGDRFYKLAHKHYGMSKLWWVIAWFNRTPTEAHLSLGDVVNIPKPLDSVLEMLDV